MLSSAALTAVKNYCTQVCSADLANPPPPLLPPSSPSPPPPRNWSPYDNSSSLPLVYSGTFNSHYVIISINNAQAKVTLPSGAVNNCACCSASTWSCSVNSNGPTSWNSNCRRLPSTALPYVREYCSRHCSTSRPTTSTISTMPERIVIVNNNPPNTCGSSGARSASAAACSFCEECHKIHVCRRRGNGPMYGCQPLDANRARDLGYVCSDFCPEPGGGTGPIGHPGTDPLPTNPPSPPNPVPPPSGPGTPSDSTGIDEDDCRCNSVVCDMIAEYKQEYYATDRSRDAGRAIYEPVQGIPSCGQFSNSGGNEEFSWQELMGGRGSGNEMKHRQQPLLSLEQSPKYGIIQSSLLTGITAIRNYYYERYHTGIPVSSGYRCPVGNDKNNSEFETTSRHMFGMAADLSTARSRSRCLLFNDIRAEVANNLQWESCDTYSDFHLHVELAGSPLNYGFLPPDLPDTP